MDVPFTTIRYNIYYLIKREMITEKKEGKYNRYFLAEKVSERDKKVLNLLRRENTRYLILFFFFYHYIPYSKEDMHYLCRNRIKTTKNFSTNLLKHHKTLTRNLKELEKLDLIEKVKVGRQVKYKTKKLEEIYDYLIRYQKTLSNKDVDFALDSMDNWLKRRGDKFEDFVSYLFPIPIRA